MESSGYRFSYWMLNGIRKADSLGRSLNPATFTITEPTTAIARYIPVGEDLDADGIPDWFEWHYYGTLSYDAGTNTDGDAFTLKQEYDRDYHPGLRDIIGEGGLSRRSSAPLLLIQDFAYTTYRIVSSPAGMTESLQAVATNSIQVLPDLFGLQSGYRFGQWLVNGARIADELGRSIGWLPFTVTSNTTAVAMFYRETEDVDADGIPDWFEWHYYGTLSYDAGTNTDGDAFTLKQEYDRDYHPGLKDIIADGGISRRSSTTVSILNGNYATFTQTSDPAGFINAQSIVLTNTTQFLADLSGAQSGYRFGQWLVDGVRIADELGRSTGGLPVLIISNTSAVAKLYGETIDTDGDGIPDWFEWQYYGSLSCDAGTNTDGDAFTLKQEYDRDYHPGLKDIIADGGISSRSSGLVFVDLRTYVFYKISSNPLDLIPTETGFILQGDLLTTTNLNGASGGYIFGHWELNGMRQQDAYGDPLHQIAFTVIGTTFATAYYYTPTADADYDGMPDWWEDQYLGGPTTGNPNADPDGDGMRNLAEYLAGTNPRSVTSLLSITNFRRAVDGFEISFSSVSGKTYLVQFSTNLTLTTNWQILPVDGNTNGVAGTGSLIQIVDPAIGESNRFYRVKLKQ